MVVGPDGALPLPWLAEPLAQILAQQRGHALLLQGAPGNGSLALSLSLAQAWLCEQPVQAGAGAETARLRPCGRCGSCHLVQTQLHPDLFVLLPEVQRRATGWLLADDKTEGEDAKRKPSKQIRIQEVRSAIDWVMKTSSRGQGKVLLMHPAETLNLQSANALLKTLEEPPAGTRILLGAADAGALLPTVRSRCQTVRLPTPSADVAQGWLAQQGVADAGVLLAACSGRPLEAQAMAQAGIHAAAWRAWPKAIAQGHGSVLTGWAVPQVVEALQKLCHDALAQACGAPGRFFPAGSVPRAASVAALVKWQGELARLARHDEHPWQEPLLLDSLLGQARLAFTLKA